MMILWIRFVKRLQNYLAEFYSRFLYGAYKTYRAIR
jgi:hypothetical protein